MSTTETEPTGVLPESRGTSAPILFALSVAVLVATTALVWYSASARYPYYFLWDMDQVMSLDTLLIESGDLPDTVHHLASGST